MFQKFLKTVSTLMILSIFGYLFYTTFGGQLLQLYTKYFPCQRPIVYNIGSFDANFGITKKDFLQAVKDAEMIWEKPLGREFFAYNANDNSSKDLKINLVYDFRQEATNKIKNLATNSIDTRVSYNTLKSKYEAMQKNYLIVKNDHNQKVVTFQANQDAYIKKVDYWNSRGGAPKDVYNEINQEKISLTQELADIHVIEQDLNARVVDINNLVTEVNDLAKKLNLNVTELNTINQTRGEEFTEGEYKDGINGSEIDIYEFSTNQKLVAVLAHELGHALGLDHVADPNAVMYYLNENKDGKLTADDLNAIKTHCGIK